MGGGGGGATAVPGRPWRRRPRGRPSAAWSWAFPSTPSPCCRRRRARRPTRAGTAGERRLRRRRPHQCGWWWVGGGGLHGRAWPTGWYVGLAGGLFLLVFQCAGDCGGGGWGGWWRGREAPPAFAPLDWGEPTADVCCGIVCPCCGRPWLPPHPLVLLSHWYPAPQEVHIYTPAAKPGGGRQRGAAPSPPPSADREGASPFSLCASLPLADAPLAVVAPPTAAAATATEPAPPPPRREEVRVLAAVGAALSELILDERRCVLGWGGRGAGVAGWAARRRAPVWWPVCEGEGAACTLGRMGQGECGRGGSGERRP